MPYNEGVKPWQVFRKNSRKASLLLAVLVLALLVFLAGRVQKPEEAKNEGAAPKITLNQEQKEKLGLDSDSDGLKDWEEIIFRTNPKNKDTDGDGTKDGEEVKIGRNPLKRGPDDEFSAPFLAEENSPYFSPHNLTGKLAEKFGINVIVPRLSGSSRPLDLESIGDQIANETLPSETQQIYFTEKDVTVAQDNSPAALRAYDKATDEILTSQFQGLQKHPLVIFSEALQIDDLSKVVALDPYLKAYDAVVEKTKELPAPSSVVSLHVRYLNALASLREAVRKMRGAESDILQAVVGARELVNTLEKIRSISIEFQSKLDER